MPWLGCADLHGIVEAAYSPALDQEDRAGTVIRWWAKGCARHGRMETVLKRGVT